MVDLLVLSEKGRPLVFITPKTKALLFDAKWWTVHWGKELVTLKAVMISNSEDQLYFELANHIADLERRRSLVVDDLWAWGLKRSEYLDKYLEDGELPCAEDVHETLANHGNRVKERNRLSKQLANLSMTPVKETRTHVVVLRPNETRQLRSTLLSWIRLEGEAKQIEETILVETTALSLKPFVIGRPVSDSKGTLNEVNFPVCVQVRDHFWCAKDGVLHILKRTDCEMETILTLNFPFAKTTTYLSALGDDVVVSWDRVIILSGIPGSLKHTLHPAFFKHPRHAVQLDKTLCIADAKGLVVFDSETMSPLPPITTLAHPSTGAEVVLSSLLPTYLALSNTTIFLAGPVRPVVYAFCAKSREIEKTLHFFTTIVGLAVVAMTLVVLTEDSLVNFYDLPSLEFLRKERLPWKAPTGISGYKNVLFVSYGTKTTCYRVNPGGDMFLQGKSE